MLSYLFHLMFWPDKDLKTFHSHVSVVLLAELLNDSIPNVGKMRFRPAIFSHSYLLNFSSNFTIDKLS